MKNKKILIIFIILATAILSIIGYNKISFYLNISSVYDVSDIVEINYNKIDPVADNENLTLIAEEIFTKLDDNNNLLLSFVIEGSDYLYDWFGKGIESRLYLRDILPCHISFTIGDSGAEYQKCGSVKLLTMENLKDQLLKYDNDFDAFMKSTGKHYVEAQLWTDKYITEDYMIK